MLRLRVGWSELSASDLQNTWDMVCGVRYMGQGRENVFAQIVFPWLAGNSSVMNGQLLITKPSQTRWSLSQRLRCDARFAEEVKVEFERMRQLILEF